MNKYQSLDLSGDYDQLLDLANRNIDTISGKYWKIHGLYRLGKLEEALELANGVQDDFLGHELEGKLQNQIGKIYGGMGEIRKSLEILKSALAINKSINNQEYMIETLLNLGNMYRAAGDIEHAYKIYQESYHFAKELDHHMYMAFSMNNLGVIYQDKGELQESIKYYQKSLTYFKEFGNKNYISVALQGLGKTHYTLGDLNSAIDYLNKAIHYQDEIGNSELIVRTLSDLILFYIDKQEMNKVEEILLRLKTYADNSSNKVFKLYYQYGRALWLKNRSRNMYKVDAQRIFEELIETNDFRFHLLIDCLYHLIELLVLEYKMYGEREVFKEIEMYSDKLYEIARDQKIYPRILDALILRSKLEIANNNFNEALNLLEQALITAEERRMSGHQHRIEEEKEKLLSNMKEMKQLVQQSNLIDLINNVELLDYIKLVQKFRS